MSIYLDNGATSYPKAPGVAEAMSEYILNIGANINRSTYGAATGAAMTVFETREMLAELFDFDDPTHVIFTPGMTAGMNMLLKGYLRPGDHVIVSAMEHNATMRPLMQLAEDGVEFSRLSVDRNGIADPKELTALIKPNTKLICVLHASNVSGSIIPVKELSDICRERGIPVALDAAQTAGHYPISFKELGLSALCMPGHKGLLGPQGIGVLMMEKNFAEKVNPLIAGGTGSASDSELLPAYMPDRFESGTLNIPGIFGLNAAVKFIMSKGTEYFRRHELCLAERFMEGLSGLPLRIAGTRDMDKRVGVVSVDFTGRDNAEAAFALEQAGILTRCGLHCAPSAHRYLGTFPQGTVRFSFGYANTEDDVDAAIAAIREYVK